jgi:NAD(P)-dependent dehydrogenase (short-subunit alcohol dehydrogenase family)
MPKKLEGKVAVITGGTEGIGLATAELFVKEGAYVFITSRRQKELDEAVKAIGTNVSGIQGDVAKLADLDRLYETVSNVKGRLTVAECPTDRSSLYIRIYTLELRESNPETLFETCAEEAFVFPADCCQRSASERDSASSSLLKILFSLAADLAFHIYKAGLDSNSRFRDSGSDMETRHIMWLFDYSASLKRR